ncbi:hypothetical protein CPB84DRAFT_655161 [Gymnopilus junonius]|uniref:Uncharacterized protein n=1 Tax=Gymnopilus junonius TaxID=109634 RepID=A0A9P5NTK9_GYMJU|nr:hypothetical protein CPB84DRAFT_655161 [Gymnopilus junonius]
MTRENGLIRHRFIRSTSATIKCLTSSERIQDLPGCWNMLIENAEKIYERHKFDGIRDIGDLVLVTKIDTDMRVSSYSWKSEDETATPPPFIEFVENEVPAPDEPWGYWEVNDQSYVTITETRCLQSIGFVQLDACDLNPSPTANPFTPATL